MRDEEQAFLRHTQQKISTIDQIKFLRELEFALNLFTNNLKVRFQQQFGIPIPKSTIQIINNIFSRGLNNA